MRRLALLVAAGAMALTGCASADASAVSPEVERPAAPPAVTGDAPPAPDFTLALAGGGTYVLSEDVKPVYLVFWAEW